MNSIRLLCLLAIADPKPLPQPIKIDGPAVVKRDRIADYLVVGDLVGAAVIWDVSPEDKADVREMPNGVLLFAGPPGEYRLKARVIRQRDGMTSVDTARFNLVVEGEKPAVPPAKPTGADPIAATARISFDNSGCTATVMYPRRKDGRWDLLTASHCTGGPGSKGKAFLRDGRILPVVVTARQTDPDLSWLRTEDASEELPFAILAETIPEPGTAVFHNGYGIDRPSNVEKGTFDSGENSRGMLSFTLNVSSGDSGGGIFRQDNGQLVSSVCCTVEKGSYVRMYGGSCRRAAALRPAG